MIAKFHNWKNQIKLFWQTNRKLLLFSGIFLGVLIMVIIFSPSAEAWTIKGIAKGFGELVLAALLSIFNALLYAFVVVIFMILSICIWIMVQAASWQEFINVPAVVAGWTIARDLVNIGFIAVLLYISFMTILNKIDWQKQLIQLLFAVILVNFSRMIVGILIDFSQVIMLTFVNGFRQIAGGNIIQKLGLADYLNYSFTGDIDEAVNIFIKLGIGIFMGILLLSIISMMAAWLIIRAVKLWLLTIMAPFYALGQFIPPLSRFTNMWKSEFTEQLIAGPFMAFGIWFALSVISSTGDSSAITTPPAEGLTEKGRFQQAGVGSEIDSRVSSVYSMIIGAALLYGVFNMSKSMAGQAAAVGTSVFSGSKAAVGFGFKKLDEGWAMGTKKFLGRDLSVGGAVDTVQAAREKMSKGWQFLRAKADSDLKDKRESKQKDKIAADDRTQVAKASYTANKASKAMIEEILGKDNKALALRDHLKKIALSAEKKNKLEAAITKAQAGDFSELGTLMGDKDYQFSDDLKQKWSNFESLESTLSSSEGTVSRFSQYMSATGENEKIDEKTLQGMVAAGILTESEAAGLNNMTWREYVNSNGAGSRGIRYKVQANRDLLNKARTRGVQESDLRVARAKGLNVDKFDIFKSALGEMGNLDADSAKAAKATKTLRAWQGGTLAAGSAGLMDAKTLGLSGDELKLLQAESLGTSEARKPALEAQKKDVERKMRVAADEMARVASEYWSEYHGRITTRAIAKRERANEKLFDEDFDERFSQYKTPEDLARLWNEQDSPEIRRRILKKVDPDDAPYFMEQLDVAPNGTGIMEVVLQTAKQFDAEMERIIGDLNKTGHLSQKGDEKKLQDALNRSIKDPLAREAAQQLTQHFRRRIPEAQFIFKSDKVTGDVEATPLSERWKKDLSLLRNNKTDTRTYGDYVSKDGVLTDVGFNYFISNGGNIHKQPNQFPEEYIMALATYKDQILAQLKKDSNYANRAEDLDKIEKLTYRRTIGKSLPFFTFSP